MGTLSLQKISANRRNAQLSTGPKTKLGKAKSALNAVKHGVFTKECLKNNREITKCLDRAYLIA